MLTWQPVAGLFPEVHTLEAVAGQILTDDISEILDRVESEARMEGRYFMCKQDGMLEVAALLQNVKALSLGVRIYFPSLQACQRDIVAGGGFCRGGVCGCGDRQ